MDSTLHHKYNWENMKLKTIILILVLFVFSCIAAETKPIKKPRKLDIDLMSISLKRNLPINAVEHYMSFVNDDLQMAKNFVDSLGKTLGVDTSPIDTYTPPPLKDPTNENIKVMTSLIKKDQPIAAMKYYRGNVNKDFKTAKAYIDSLKSAYGKTSW